MKRFIAVIVAVCSLTSMAGAGECGWRQKLKEKREQKAGTVAETIGAGIGMGASTGLSAGWVRYYRPHYEMQNIWDSVGYGALGGLGLGVGAAVLGRNGTGFQYLNDIDAVAGAGGTAGFFWGIVSALFTGDSERVGSGLAWGQLGGTVLGIGFASTKAVMGKYTAVEKKEEVRYRFELREDSAARPYVVMAFRSRF